MAQKQPITKTGFEKLAQELKHLKNVERPAVIAAIAEARSHGDLSENAEYHAAKEKQGLLESRINYLENKLSVSEIIDVQALSGDKVLFGGTVVLIDEETEKVKTFQIVGSDEADVEKGLLSVTSPLARSLLGKKEGESVEVNTPNGTVYYTVQNIKFI